MTTPASNIDSGLPTAGSVYRTVTAKSGAILVPRHLYQSGNTMMQWRANIRPASKKSVKDSSGWRQPLSYSLTRETSAIHCGYVEAINIDVLGTVTKDEYFDGYGCDFREQRLSVIDLNLENRALTAALSKLKNQGVNFGVAFGEYKETADMISSAATRIAKSVRGFRSKNPREWGQVVRNQLGQAVNGRGKSSPRGRGIPNSWLELQYGWNPMMQDVKSAAAQLSGDASGGHPFRVHVTSQASSDLTATSWGKTTDATQSGLLKSRTGKQFCFVRLDYELQSPLLATLSSLGLTNPAEIVWELLPYSFVVDWFFPFGGWLGALDADFGWKFLAGTNTVGFRYRIVGEGTRDRHLSSSWSYSGLAASTQNVISFQRSVYPSSPRPGLPTVKNPLSAGHVANALSLLLNAFH